MALTIGAIAQAPAGGDAKWRFLALLGAAALLWATELIPASIVGLALIAARVVAGVAAPAQAVAGFGSTDWLFVLSIFGLSAAVERSGLLFRLGLLLVRRLRRGAFGQAVGLLATSVGLLPVLPNTYARVTLMTRLAQATSQALQLEDREPTAALLGMIAWIATGPMYFLVLNASPLNLLLWGAVAGSQSRAVQLGTLAARGAAARRVHVGRLTAHAAGGAQASQYAASTR
jgi:di/tricarboxylate transporter